MMSDQLSFARRSLAAAALGAMLVGSTAAPSGAYPRPGMNERVSLSSDGREGHTPTPDLTGVRGMTTESAISANGRFVAFQSSMVDLVPGDDNAAPDIFLHDRATKKTVRISAAPDGTDAVGTCVSLSTDSPGTTPYMVGSLAPSISATGRYVAFSSCAVNLVPGEVDTNATLDVFVHDRNSGLTRRVSVASDGGQASRPPAFPWSAIGRDALSDSGRFVVFDSAADNLVPNDTNDEVDSFLHDMKTGKTERISVSTRERQQEGNTSSGAPGTTSRPPLGGWAPSTVGATGEYVAFTSAGNLGDESGSASPLPIRRVYLRDRKLGKTEMISVNSQEEPASAANQLVSRIAISADGRFVLFNSENSSLVPNDADRNPAFGDSDVFVRDRKTGRTGRVSVNSWGEEGVGIGPIGPFSVGSALSRGGRFVAFTSLDSNFAPDDPRPGDLSCNVNNCGYYLTYVFDRRSGAIELITRYPDGKPAGVDAQSATSSSLSADGRYIAFSSFGALVEGDTNKEVEIYVRDRGMNLGIGGLARPSSPSLAGRPSFSSTGLIYRADDLDDVDDVLTKLGADLTAASLAYRPQHADLFARLQVESMPPFALANPALQYGLDLRANGLRYQVRVQKVGADASFGLFRFDSGLWIKVADLRGGYGTTGEEVVFALPLRELGLQAAGRLGRVAAFTALGVYNQPLQDRQILDGVALDGHR